MCIPKLNTFFSKHKKENILNQSSKKELLFGRAALAIMDSTGTPGRKYVPLLRPTWLSWVSLRFCQNLYFHIYSSKLRGRRVLRNWVLWETGHMETGSPVTHVTTIRAALMDGILLNLCSILENFFCIISLKLQTNI